MIMFTNLPPTILDIAALKWVMRQKLTLNKASRYVPLKLGPHGLSYTVHRYQVRQNSWISISAWLGFALVRVQFEVILFYCILLPKPRIAYSLLICLSVHYVVEILRKSLIIFSIFSTKKKSWKFSNTSKLYSQFHYLKKNLSNKNFNFFFKLLFFWEFCETWWKKRL